MPSTSRVKKKRSSNMDDDHEEGLGRVHQDDFVRLESPSESEEADEDEEHAVLGLEESEEESDDNEDSEDMDEEQLTGLAAKIATQSKQMRRKADLEDDDDNDDSDDTDGTDEEHSGWGKSRKSYYNADNVDYELQSDDDEAPAEEEIEAKRMQRKTAESLRPEDFDQSIEDLEDGAEETLEEAVNRKDGVKPSSSTAKVSASVAVEQVERDINALSKEEKMDVVMSDAPELVGLLTELREGLDELRNKVQPVIEMVKDRQFATKEGISYLEVKNLLLVSYCQSIIFYLLLKAEGRSVRDHPVIPRLVELRLFLEKIRPIDKKLQYQIDKLLKAATKDQAEQSSEHREDALKYRPNPESLVSKLDEQAQNGAGLYRPPMIAPVAMEDERRPKDKRQKDRAEKESRRRASRSAYMKEIANELEGKPEEVQETVGTESKEMMREKARLDARAKEEEELFARVPLTRVERKKLKQLKQTKSGVMDLLDDFDDGLADLVGMDEERGRPSAGGPPDDLLKPKRLSQVIAEGGRAARKPKPTSGDANLPIREELGERRRKREMEGIRSTKENSGSEGEDRQDFQPEEDEFYKEAKELASAKKAAKRAKYEREAVVPSGQEDAEGKRHITTMMEKNRGLVPHRKKLTKNPRKKYKLKHDKAVIRRKGQLRAPRTDGGSYAGEAAGVRTNLSRSVRFQH